MRSALHGIVAEHEPMTVRQVFYRAVVGGLIDKTEAEYKRTVCRLLADMRKRGEIPFSWIADNTRWMRKPDTYSSLEDMLRQSQRFYRRALWDEQNSYVEVWLEKEALAGVLYDVTHEWDVPLMVTRGYPSLTFLHGAAETIAQEWRRVNLYYFGDHDPSGQDISRFVEESLRQMAPRTNMYFERVAVTPEQIEGLQLPTRPTKRSDSRAMGFEGESVEVDAIEPNELREMCRRCIIQHLDTDILKRVETAEEAERCTLQAIIENLATGFRHRN